MSPSKKPEVPKEYLIAAMYYSMAKNRRPVTVGRKEYAVVKEYLEWCKQHGVTP